MEGPVDCKFASDAGGKAGKHVIHVVIGAEDYLYKSNKKCPQLQTPLRIDFHGCTRDETIKKLNDSMPSWMDAAMKDYPWTLRVDTITGGGHQVIAEAVGHWIRSNKNVVKRF
jgi:DNA-nicking Smr family endonuclease